jgi:hypothetical protein
MSQTGAFCQSKDSPDEPDAFSKVVDENPIKITTGLAAMLSLLFRKHDYAQVQVSQRVRLPTDRE